MKRQYLGDSKDSFKWDYHDFLTDALDYRQLQVVWMMTPDDPGPDGRTPPERFPARFEIIQFCNYLRKTQDPHRLLELPRRTRARYAVSLYKTDEYLTDHRRASYFAEIERQPERVIFLDPDNGLEPEARFCEKHLCYGDIRGLLKTISPRSVISVFQHHRRRKFEDDFAHIRKRLENAYATAICWQTIMFVNISSSKETIGRVQQANNHYALARPVRVLT